MKKNHPDPIELRSYHEAGHAFAAWLRGVVIDFATIESDDGAPGHVAYNSWASARQHGDICAAGVAAVALRYGWSLRTTSDRLVAINNAGGVGDWDQIRELGRDLHPDLSDAKLDRWAGTVVTDVRDELSQHWGAVVALANELQKYRSLSGHQINRLLTPLVSRDPSPSQGVRS